LDVPIAGLAPADYAVVIDGDAGAARTVVAFRVTP
jgi:hypothetical protein